MIINEIPTTNYRIKQATYDNYFNRIRREERLKEQARYNYLFRNLLSQKLINFIKANVKDNSKDPAIVATFKLVKDIFEANGYSTDDVNEFFEHHVSLLFVNKNRLLASLAILGTKNLDTDCLFEYPKTFTKDYSIDKLYSCVNDCTTAADVANKIDDASETRTINKNRLLVMCNFYLSKIEEQKNERIIKSLEK